MLSHVQLFATPWTVAYRDPLSVGFFRQEYWSGLLFPTLGDLPDPEIKLVPPALVGGFSTTELPRNFNISHAARQKKKKRPSISYWQFVIHMQNLWALVTLSEFESAFM